MKLNKKGFSTTAVVMGLVFAVILIVIGVTIANDLNTGAITATSANQTPLVYVSGTSVNYSLTPVEQGIVSGTVRVYNATVNLTIADNFTVDLTTGVLNVEVAGNNTFSAEWDYEHFGFVRGATRTVIIFIPLMLAIAALGIAAAFAGKNT